MKKIYTYLLMVLMATTATMAFTSCETEDQYEAEVLTAGDWQGYLGAYYHDRWGLIGNSYETVIRFCSRGYGATSGRGYEVDYDVRSPYYDYAYCEFTWSVVDGLITLIYDDSMWYPVYISNYSLSNNYFSGYMNDGTSRDIRFKLKNVRFDDWDTYRSYGDYYYDGYYYDDYYYSRTRSAADSTLTAPDSIPFLNRTEIARQESGEPTTVSVASGVFAKAIQKETDR